MIEEKQLERGELVQNSLVKKNLKALEAGGQFLALTWLMEAGALKPVAEISGEGGRPVLKVSGQTQASRRDPEREAGQWLEKIGLPAGPVVLFGLGSPYPAALILAHKALTVYEPDPLVLLAAFSHYDFSAALAEPGQGLTLLTPWHLAAGKGPFGGGLLIHPPAQRRQPAQLNNLTRALNGEARDLRGRFGPLKIMVLPPLSGGSWPVAVSLARAAEAAGHQVLFLDWPQELLNLERQAQAAQGGEAGRLTAKLFEAAGPQAADQAEAFQPDLIIALAQAPLDVPALGRLRGACAAPLAFWLVEDIHSFAYVAEVAPAYDAVFHIQKGLVEPVFKDWGLGRVFYLPLAADPGLFQPRSEDETKTYQAELSFMGAGYPNRRRLLGRLAGEYWPSSGRPAGAFKIFGSGWDGADPFLSRHLFEGGRRVSLPECALIYAGGRINLNIHSSRKEAGFDPGSCFVNPRTFEIAAAGGFQIVDERPLLAEMFEPGRELAVARKPDDLPELIDYYLARPEEAAAMGRAARLKVLAGHTYGHRLKEMLEYLGWTDIAPEGSLPFG